MIGQCTEQLLLFMFGFADLADQRIELGFKVGQFPLHPSFHRLPP